MLLGPISAYKTDGIAQENQLLTLFNRSAKPPFVGSTPTRASTIFQPFSTYLLKIVPKLKLKPDFLAMGAVITLVMHGGAAGETLQPARTRSALWELLRDI
jgi:hypothetical protein